MESLRGRMVWLDDVDRVAHEIAKELIDKYAADDDVDDVEAVLSQVTEAEMATIRTRLRSPKTPGSSSGPRSSGSLYDLFAVIMHRGSAHSGHYFAYIKDSLEEGQWGLGRSGGAARQLVSLITDPTQLSMSIKPPLSEPLQLSALSPSAQLPLVQLSALNPDHNDSSFFGTGGESLTIGELPPGLHRLDSTDMLYHHQQPMMAGAATWNSLGGLDLGANNLILHQQQQQQQPQQQPQLMSYNNFGNQHPLAPLPYGQQPPPHSNYGELLPNVGDFGFNNNNGHDQLLALPQQRQYFNDNGVMFLPPLPAMQQVFPPLPPPPGFSQSPFIPPPGLASFPPGLSSPPGHATQFPLPSGPDAYPYAPVLPDPSSLSPQTLSVAPSATSSSMPVTMSSPSPQPQPQASSSSTAVLGLKQILKMTSDGGVGGLMASPPPPPPPLVSSPSAEKHPDFSLFKISNTGVIQVERNSALGVLVDIVGKGCPNRLQGRSFKVLKTTLRDLNATCFELLESVKGKGKRWYEKPYSYIRGNKDLFSIVGEGQGVKQFIAMVDEPEVELKGEHFFKGEDAIRIFEGETLLRILVKEGSELGLVVSVLKDKGEIRFGDSWDALEAQLKAELSPSVNTYRKPLKLGYKSRDERSRHLKDNEYVKDDVYVGDEFAIHQGDTWTKMYEKQHGDIVEFIAKHKHIFTTPERIEGPEGHNSTWQDTDLDLKPSARVMLRQDTKIELVDTFEPNSHAASSSLPPPAAPSLPMATPIQAAPSSDFSSSSVRQNDTHRLLPRISRTLEAKLSDITGSQVCGDSMSGITVIRESSALGILVECFLSGKHKLYRQGHGGGKPFVLFGDLDALLMGESHKSVLHRFPDFPGMKDFLSNHQDLFYSGGSEGNGIDVERLKADAKIYLRNHLKTYCVVNDEKYLKICAAVGDTIPPVAQVERAPVDGYRGALFSVAAQRGRAGSNLSSASTPQVISSDRGDRGVTLPASSALKTNTEKIIGKALRGSATTDDVTVYPESCPVGVLVNALKKETRIRFSGVSDMMKGRYKSVKDRFPGFPGMRLFLSRHPHLFILNVDEEKYQEKKKLSKQSGGVSAEDFSTIILNNPACHHVVNDEHFAQICALADAENGNTGPKQVQGSGLGLEESRRRVRTESNLSIAGDSVPVMSTDRGDRGVTLPASSALRARAEEIIGSDLRGCLPADDVTVYRLSTALGVLVKCFVDGSDRLLHRGSTLHRGSRGGRVGGGRSYVLFGDLDAVLMGESHKSVQQRFPDFPGVKDFLSNHQDTFMGNRQTDIDVRQLQTDTKIFLRNHYKTCIVVNDEKYLKLCAADGDMILTDRGDRGVTLPASSALKTKAEEIVGIPLRGGTPVDDVAVYPDSCPVGVLVKALKTEARAGIRLPSVGRYLGRGPSAHKTSVTERFPGFPGIKPFVSKHPHIFIINVDEEEYQEQMKNASHTRAMGLNRQTFSTLLLKTPARHHVVSDEQFATICALADAENGNHGPQQVLGSGVGLEHVSSSQQSLSQQLLSQQSLSQQSLSQQSLSQSETLATAVNVAPAPIVDERDRRMRSESNLSTASVEFDSRRGLHFPQPSLAEQVSYHPDGLQWQGLGQWQGQGLGQGLGYLGHDVSGSRPDCSSDEAIAQTMGQLGLEATTSFDRMATTATTEAGGDERLGGGGMVDPNDAPDSWEQAASGKKKGKNKGRGSSEGTAAGGGGGSNELVTADARSQRLIAREKQLAEELMGMTYGRYFEFNDTTVTPMPLRNLEKSFEGKESAYILVYRKHLDPSSLVLPPTKVPPPAFWAEKAIQENQSLKLQREQYNAQSHTAVVRFLCPGHLRFKDPLLEIDQPVVSVVPGMPKDWSHFIDLSVDLRNSIDEVKAYFLKTCRAHVMGLGLLADPLEPGSDQTILSKLVVSNLDKYGEGYHPSMPLGSGSNATERGAVCIGDVISESATLLVWNGKSIGGSNVHAGRSW